MPIKRRSPLYRYGFAVVCVALAVGGRLLLDPFLGNAFPFASIFLAILVTAWFDGFSAALVALMVGAVAAEYFLLEPRYSFAINRVEAIGLVLYLITGLGIALFGGAMKAAQARAEAAAREAGLINEKLEARVRERTEEVGHSEARLGGIVASAMDAIISVDSAQKIVLFNAAAEKLFRYPAAEAIGQPLDRFLPKRFRKAHREHVESFGKTGVTSRSMHSLGELSGLRSDGVEFPIEASISQVEVTGEKIYTVILRDVTERQKADEASALLSAIVDSSSDAIVGKNLHSIVTSWNAGAEKMFGYTAGEMIGRPVTVLIPPERQQEEESILSRIRRGEAVEHFETVRVRKGGRSIDVSVTVSPIRNAQGEIVGASKVARDISEQKRAEVSRRISEARYRALFDYAPDGILIGDSNSTYIDANASMCRLLGYTRNELVGMNATDIIAEELTDRIGPVLEEIRAGASHHREWQFRRKDGSLVPVEVIATQMPDGNILGMIRDITERKMAEQAVMASEMRYRRLFESSKDGILILDAESGMIVDVNPFLIEMLGYSHEVFLGKAIWELGFFKNVVANRDNFAELKAKEYIRYENLPLETFEGRRIEVEFVSNVYLVNNGKVIQCNIRDVSERIKAERELRASEQRMRLATETTSVGIWEWNVLTNQIRWDAAMFRIYGLPPTANGFVPYSAWTAAVLPEDLQKQEEILQDTLRRRGSSSREFRICRSVDGKIRHIHAVETVRNNARGEAEWVVGTNLDITERHEAEAALRGSEQLLQTVMDLVPHSIFAKDSKSRHILVNRACAAANGRTPAQMIGLCDLDFVANRSQAEAFMSADREVFDSGRPKFIAEECLTDGDGKLHVFQTTKIPFAIPGLDGPALVGVAVDITEVKQAEKALREKEAQLHATDRRLAEIVHGMNEACFALDAEWRFTFVNNRGETLLRHKRKDMIGRSIWEVFKKLVGTPMEANYRRAMTERVPVTFEVFSPIAERWLDIRLFPTGEGLAAFLLDIHERKLGEVALYETQTRLNSTLSAGSIGTWSWDIANDRLVADEFTARVFSIDKAEAANGLPAAAYLKGVVEEDQPSVSAQLAEAIKTCGNYDIEYRVRQKQGDVVWLQARGRVEGDAAGSAVHFHGAVMDITARKRAEMAQRESEERFRTMANSIPQLAWIAQADGYIFWYNERWYQYTGTKPQEMEGWGWQKVHDPNVLPKVMQRWTAAIEACEPFEMEFPLRGADGRFRTFLTRVQPLKNAEGRVVQWFGTNTDVEVLKHAEEKLRLFNTELEQRVTERTAQLESANKELEAFSYSVSHDLRAPLRAMDGFSQAVLEDCAPQLSDEGVSYLKTIREGAQRMGALIDDLLTFSRLSRAPLKIQEVNTDVLVRGVLEDLRSEREGRKIELHVGELPDCMGDPALLKQVWINLLSNAFKYTQKRKIARVEIGIEPGPEGEVYYVRDNGTGFDMRYSGKLFGVFQRLHRSEDFEGTGVGLAIVQRIILRHGGRVWAYSEPDRGATFYFTLQNETKS